METDRSTSRAGAGALACDRLLFGAMAEMPVTGGGRKINRGETSTAEEARQAEREQLLGGESESKPPPQLSSIQAVAPRDRL